MALTVEEKELEYNGVKYYVDVEVYGELVDESFDHEFGTESCWGVEVTGIDIATVTNEEGNIITSRTIISALENLLDLEDFEDVEFDFSE
jgi:hypothetical protein